MRCALDSSGRHVLALDDGVLSLVPPVGDRRSRGHEALLASLVVRSGGVEQTFSGDARVTLRGTPAEVLLDDLGSPLLVARIDGAAIESVYRLSPFEVRYAEDNGAIHPVPAGARVQPAWAPRTDLHTHFAACVRAADLVELGAAHGVSYPGALLEEAGIHLEGPGIALSELAAPLRARLAARLEVPLDRRITFPAMEAIYRLRGPITKAPALFLPLLARAAEDYAAQGIAYAELSLGSVTSAAVLRAIHGELPAIEARTGTRLRFLVAISRHDDPEWDLDLVDRIREVGASRYIVGVDFMGHETNSTSAFAPILRLIADWAHEARPGFVVRVHAGESPSHPENVRLALDAVRGRRVLLRIGHGLFGVDDQTLDALVADDVIVEFNLDSNVALNHLTSGRDVALRRYVERGARVVLGSDGYGLYGTTPAGMVRAALVVGLPPGALGRLEAVEADYLAQVTDVPPFVVPDDRPPVHFTPAVALRRRAAKAAVRRELDARLASVGLPLIDGAALAVLLERRAELVSIAGSWRESWQGMSDTARATASREIEAFIAALDRQRTLLVTGGTHFGVEGVAARAARARGIEVLAAIVEATPPEALEGSLADAAYLVGDTLYEKAAGLYALIAEHDGLCLFVGGGQIVSDEIQTARNLHLRYLLFVGAGGASERHALERPVHAVRSGRAAAEAFAAWRAQGADVVPHWFVGPNPTVDLVVLRGAAVLLVLRDREAPAAPNEWALPGGYVASASARGETWQPAESATDAALRELAEETGLVLPPDRLEPIGVFEGGGRDPRDDARGWSRSSAFRVHLREDETPVLSGGEDAADARFVPLAKLPPLAFDHAAILSAALARPG